MGRIENFQYEIQKAFRDCLYVVPDYQREYVWTDREVVQLLDDINEQQGQAGESGYFVGMVLVSPQQTRNCFEVIDGQQRLTTFFLMLCVLRAKFEAAEMQQTGQLGNLIRSVETNRTGDEIAVMHLDPRYENANEVLKWIVDVCGDPDAVDAKIRSTGIQRYGSAARLLDAYRTIFEYLDNQFPTAKELRSFWGYLATGVNFIQIQTDVSTALKIFETINERGVGLNPMDLLKNLLFSNVKNVEFERLRQEWKRITDPLEKRKERPLRFLRYFLMASYDIDVGDRTDKILREDEIYDWLRLPATKTSTQLEAEPFEFVRKISNGVGNFTNFREKRDAAGVPCRELESLERLTGGAYSLHLILLLATSSMYPENFRHFVRNLESTLFYLIFSRTQAKEQERMFAHWAGILHDISGVQDKGEQASRLHGFIDTELKKVVLEKSPIVLDSMTRYTTKSMQQYRTRYLLVRIAEYVDSMFRGSEDPGPFADFQGLQIEHILPQNPSIELRRDWESENADAEYAAYVAKLGNLTLLERPLNSVASNDFFERKVPEYGKSSAYLTRSLSGLVESGQATSINRIRAKLEEFNQWTAEEIDRRQRMLIRMIPDIWKIYGISTK